MVHLTFRLHIHKKSYIISLVFSTIEKIDLVFFQKYSNTLIISHISAYFIIHNTRTKEPGGKKTKKKKIKEQKKINPAKVYPLYS